MFRQIQYFQAVVQHHSFSKAAEESHLSQSAMSQQIKSLELALGFSLLERKNRSFTLTPAGEYFYQKSLILLDQLDKLCQESKKIALGNQVALKIGVLRTLSSEALLQALEDFSKQYPHVEMELASGNHEDLFEWIRSDKVDLVLNDQRRAFSQEYNNFVLTRVPLQLEVARHHPLAKLAQVEISKTQAFPCLIISSLEQQNQEQDYFQSVLGFSSTFQFVSNLEEAKWTLISSQSVWPRLSIDTISPFAKRISLMRHNQPIVQTICLFWKRDNSGYYVEEFAEKLKECYERISLAQLSFDSDSKNESE